MKDKEVKEDKIAKKKNIEKCLNQKKQNFFIIWARLVFNKLWQIFVKALIFYHFNLLD